MSHLRIVNRTRGTLVGSRVAVADRWWSRLRGFLARPRPDVGEGILLVPCNAVHSYGMAFPVDVLFLNGEGRVLHIVRDMSPWRRTPRIRAARYVLELPVGTVDATGTQDGDEFSWMPPRSAMGVADHEATTLGGGTWKASSPEHRDVARRTS